MKKQLQSNVEMDSPENSLDRQTEHKLVKMLNKYLDIQAEKKSVEEEYKLVSSNVLQIFKNLGIRTYSFIINEGSLDGTKATFTKAKRTLVNYDIDKLKETLGKETVDNFLDKDYIITDFDKFKKVMKDYGVPFKEVKDIIEVKESVNSARLQNMVEREKVSLRKIKGCYSLSISEYITSRISKE